MQVFLNGQTKEVPEHCSLQELVESLDLKADRLAIELNHEIVRRQDWSDMRLRTGDQLEIVHFVGGG